MPPETRTCACGCLTQFVTTHPHRRYLNRQHWPRKGSHYTADEKRARAALFATLPNGAPCHWCGQPMTNEQRAAGQLISGHVIDKVLGGADLGLRYEHKTCGYGAGGRLGRRRDRQRRARGAAVVRTSRRW